MAQMAEEWSIFEGVLIDEHVRLGTLQNQGQLGLFSVRKTRPRMSKLP